jgi:hypothetical protein
MVQAPQVTDLGKRVEQYVGLRDKIKRMDDAHKEKMKPFREALDQLNILLLHSLQTIGTDSATSQYGTVYRTDKKTASTADGEAFRQFVIEHQMFDMVDWKPNVKAVEDFIEANKTLPPGVNFNTVAVVGVRRK